MGLEPTPVELLGAFKSAWAMVPTNKDGLKGVEGRTVDMLP